MLDEQGKRMFGLPAATRDSEEESTMAENTVKLHRVLRAPAERIYRAFIDPDAMVQWLPPHGFTLRAGEQGGQLTLLADADRSRERRR